MTPHPVTLTQSISALPTKSLVSNPAGMSFVDGWILYLLPRMAETWMSDWHETALKERSSVAITKEGGEDQVEGCEQAMLSSKQIDVTLIDQVRDPCCCFASWLTSRAASLSPPVSFQATLNEKSVSKIPCHRS